MHLDKFAVKLGFHNVRQPEFKRILKYLQKADAVAIQQSGYKAHSLYHDKLAIIKDPTLVNFYVKEGEVYAQEKRKVRVRKVVNRPQCKFEKDCKFKKKNRLSETIVCTWASTCNQQLENN